MTVDEIRERWSKVPHGPWAWGGNIQCDNIYLSTADRGGVFLMQFDRLGMRDGQPTFQVEGRMRPVYSAKEDGPRRQDTQRIGMVVKERAYRGDIADIDHPMAQCIKHSVSDVEFLLEEVARLEEALRRVTELPKDIKLVYLSRPEHGWNWKENRATKPGEVDTEDVCVCSYCSSNPHYGSHYCKGFDEAKNGRFYSDHKERW